MMTRRIFLKNGSLALVSLGFTPAFIARTAHAARARNKVLIAIFQRGAVDGLNMVVPFGDPEYYRARPGIAIAKPGERPRQGQGQIEESAIDLDGFFGLSARMAPFAPLFQSGELAIVHACGSHDPTRSHFDAQDFMESGTPGVKSTRDGWLNRYLHAKQHEKEAQSPFRAVALAQQLPRTLQGTAPALAIGQVSQFGVRAGRSTDMMTNGFESQYKAAADSLLGNTGKEAFDAVRKLEGADAATYVPENGAEYPRSGFGEAMKQIAMLVKRDLGLEVAFTELGGWDTHAQQPGRLPNLLGDMANTIAAFRKDLGDRMADVVVVTMSEFGRTVKENGNRGTDHGHGNAMFILGGPVKGGQVYGKWPGLGREHLYEGRDLAITTDFRDVFAEVVTKHLNAKDTSKIFPGYVYKQQLGMIRS